MNARMSSLSSVAPISEAYAVLFLVFSHRFMMGCGAARSLAARRVSSSLASFLTQVQNSGGEVLGNVVPDIRIPCPWAKLDSSGMLLGLAGGGGFSPATDPCSLLLACEVRLLQFVEMH